MLSMNCWSAAGFEAGFASREQMHAFHASSAKAVGSSVQARVLMFPNCQDQLHPLREGGMLQAMHYIPVAKLVNYDDVGGYHGPIGSTSLAAFATEVRDLLKRVEEGRPGINGPCIPKNFARTDQCPR